MNKFQIMDVKALNGQGRAVAKFLCALRAREKKRLGDAPRPPQKGGCPFEPRFFPLLQQPATNTKLLRTAGGSEESRREEI